jgi:hypothetical protein
MHFTFTVEVDAERTEGKFASRDELAEQIQEALESADPGSLEGDNGGQYELTWEVEEQEQKPRKRSRR